MNQITPGKEIDTNQRGRGRFDRSVAGVSTFAATLKHRLCRFALAAGLLAAAADAQAPLHLLGFVEDPCPGERYCFDLRVEPEFVAAAGERIRVRFADVLRIYDPENYELTLAQQNIARGSHLRLLLEADERPGEYRARFIWIGD